MAKFKIGEIAILVGVRGEPARQLGIQPGIEVEILSAPTTTHPLAFGIVSYEIDIPGHTSSEGWMSVESALRKKKPPKEELGDWDTIENDTKWGDKEGYRPHVPTLTEIADNKEKVRETVK